MTLDKFIRVEKALGVRRTIVLGTTLALTVHSYLWAVDLAKQLLAQGLNNEAVVTAGLLIVAVTGPISVLQNAVFKSYITSKEDPEPTSGA